MNRPFAVGSAVDSNSVPSSALFSTRRASSAADDREPTPDELAAIELEWPLIEAEMNLVDAEARVLTAVPHPTELDWCRLRQAEYRVVVAWRDWHRGQSTAEAVSTLGQVA